MGAGLGYGRLDSLLSLGYSSASLHRIWTLADGRFGELHDIARVMERFSYESVSTSSWQIRSAQSSMLFPNITCINAAILSYALLDCFPEVRRKMLLIQRCDVDGTEHGHIVTTYQTPEGRTGAFGKSHHDNLANRAPLFDSETEIAASYVRSYIDIGYAPRYFGYVPLEEAARGLDWRLGEAPLAPLLERLIGCYGYAAPDRGQPVRH